MEQPITHASYLSYLSDNRLMGTRCLDCQQIYLPPRAICRRCHSERLEWLEMPGRGRLAAFTRIAVGQSRMAEAGYSRENPYWSGVVELENGARISAQILGLEVFEPEAVGIGSAGSIEILQREAPGEPLLAFRVDQPSR